MAAEVYLVLNEVSPTGSKLVVTPVFNGQALRKRIVHCDWDASAAPSVEEFEAALPFLIKQATIDKNRSQVRTALSNKQIVTMMQTKVS